MPQMCKIFLQFFIFVYKNITFIISLVEILTQELFIEYCMMYKFRKGNIIYSLAAYPLLDVGTHILTGFSVYCCMKEFSDVSQACQLFYVFQDICFLPTPGLPFISPSTRNFRSEYFAFIIIWPK